MEECWQQEPKYRPTFSDILKSLNEVMMEVGDRAPVGRPNVENVVTPAEKGSKAAAKNKHTLLMRRPSVRVMEKGLVRQQTLHNIDTSTIKHPSASLSNAPTSSLPQPHTVSFNVVGAMDENFSVPSSSLSTDPQELLSTERHLERTKSMFGMKKNLNTLKNSTFIMMDDPMRHPTTSQVLTMGLKEREKEKEKEKEKGEGESGSVRRKIAFQEEE